MKKLFLALAAVATLVACKKDDNSNNNSGSNASIVGSWLAIEYSITYAGQTGTQNVESEQNIVQFTADGKAYFSSGGVAEDTASYTLNGSTLTVGMDGDFQSLNVSSLTATELRMVYSEYDSTISMPIEYGMLYERQ